MCLGNLCPGVAGSGVHTQRRSPPSPQAPQHVGPRAGTVPASGCAPRRGEPLARTSAPSHSAGEAGPAARQASAPRSFCARSP